MSESQTSGNQPTAKSAGEGFGNFMKFVCIVVAIKVAAWASTTDTFQTLVYGKPLLKPAELRLDFDKSFRDFNSPLTRSHEWREGVWPA